MRSTDCPAAVEEILYPAMEDFELDIVIGQGPAARSVRLTLPHFTLVGATTRTGLLTAPLRDRFGIVHRLEFYPPEELAAIVERSARILDIGSTTDARDEVAMRARGTPRIANRLLRRVRDFAHHLGTDGVTLEAARFGLEQMEVDAFGLDHLDRRLLTTIIEIYNGGPVGLKALAASLGEDRGTLEDINEPYLLQIGLLQRTPRGRMVTPRAFRHLGLDGALGGRRPLRGGGLKTIPDHRQPDRRRGAAAAFVCGSRCGRAPLRCRTRVAPHRVIAVTATELAREAAGAGLPAGSSLRWRRHLQRSGARPARERHGPRGATRWNDLGAGL